MILREEGSSTRQIIEDALAEAGVAPQVVMENGSREALHEAVAAGLGIGVVSAAELGTDDRLTVVKISDTRLEAQEFVVCLKERRNVRTVQAFFDLARGRGIPRDLRWVECEWLPEVTFGRSVDEGRLTAFVGVNIRFEAIEGGDMEDVEAVGLIRDATAIFHFQDGHWGTGGRAMFNMDPHAAIDRLVGQFEPVTAS